MLFVILHTAHMQVALGERNLNARLAKPAINVLMQVTGHLPPGVEVRDPGAQLKIERTVPETAEQHLRLGTLQHSGVGQRALFQRLHDERNVRPIRHAHRE